MHEYLIKLKNEKKDLKNKMNIINRFIDSSFGKKDYFVRKRKYYDELSKIRKKIYIINKKMEFVINLKSCMESKNEEQIIKIDFNI